MNEMNYFQSMPLSLWIVATASGLVIILLMLFLHLFYRKRLQAMEPINDDVGDLINLKQQLEGDVDSLKNWIAEQEDELQRLKSEREEQEIIRNEIQRLEQEAAQKEEDNKTLRDEVGSLENQRHMLVQAIENLEQEKSKIKNENKSLGEEATKLNKELKKIDKDIAKYKREEEKITNKIENLKSKIERLEEQERGLQAKIKDAKSELEKLKKDSEKAKNELEELEKETRQSQSDISTLNEEKAGLSAKVETLSNKLKSIGTMPRSAFDSLNIKFIDKPDIIRNNIDEQDALDRLYSLTLDSGFELPKRLQNAYHTSLKTSDISCLTVMAGVSGTGKSAFPKIYCQAMGLHFLPLAVEPRWDSPQDLFGFLNYMESRFESTSLGRSLVQFDNSPHASENANLKDQILVVLLDEMNLARIEYYFSEFLSKLEMRRNVDINKIEDFRMVSTEIYAGSKANEETGAEKGDPIFLYAGTNVLFVGTMNEDETTQSLSDKVIDRANVLYFGKPEKMRNQKQESDTNNNWAPISKDNWDKWIIKFADENSISDYDRVDNMLNDINITLSDLGRPFGWRTYKAMLTYIANHPNVKLNNNSGMQPLADQIAMRVMPKLRGLDLGENAEIFNRLNNQLNDINDDDLNQAFKKAQNSSMGYFDWRGIQWTDN